MTKQYIVPVSHNKDTLHCLFVYKWKIYRKQKKRSKRYALVINDMKGLNKINVQSIIDSSSN